MKETKFKQTDIGLIPEDWKIDILDKAFQFLPTNTYAREFMDEKTGDVHNIHYGDILVKYGSIVDFERDSVPCLKQSVDSGDERNYLKNGDLIIADTAEDETAGKTVEIFNLGGKKAVAGLHTFACRPKIDFASKYLGYFSNCAFFHNQMKPYFTGTKVTSISKSCIKKIFVTYPSSKDEQERIANALSQVDDLLAALDEQIEKKKLIKQGTMQQLLTGKTRLKGFSGKWMTVKLGDVADIRTGKRNGDENIESGLYPFFVRSQSVYRINSYSYDGEAILIPGEGGIGKIFHYINGKFDYHQRVYKISDFPSNFDTKFVYFYLMKFFGSHALQNTVKATVDSLRLPTFQDFMLVVPPTLAEQQTIASILSTMDDEIQALQEERDKYALVKQGMMQQLLTGKIRLN